MNNVDTTQTITHLGLCAGYGGIELGLKRVLPALRTVALCEIEAFAIANLGAKMEAGLMDPAPIWTDLKTFPWAEFRDRVDILTGGYPCQPFSAAGKRLGTDDPRHLWPYIASGIRLLRPKLCFFENVEGHITLGLREVVGELEELGYETAWGIFSAAECGAPHQRKRVFILAYRDSERGQLSDWRRFASKQVSLSNGAARGNVWPSRPGEPQHFWEPPRVVVGRMANTNSGDSSQNRGDNGEVPQVSAEQRTDYSASVSGGESQHRGEEPPRLVANSQSKRASSGRELCGEECGQGRALPCESDEPSESMGNAESGDGQWSAQGEAGHAAQPDEGMGDTRGDGWREDQQGRESKGRVAADGAGETGCQRQTESALGGDSHGTTSGLDYAELYTTCDNRTDELRLLGNGVVPATAEKAFRTLLDEVQPSVHQ